MTVMILVITLEVVLVLRARYFSFDSSDDEFKSFVSPFVLGSFDYLGLRLVSTAVSDGATFEFLMTETKFFEVFAHFRIRNSSIEVFIHLAHKLKHLLLSDCESHALKHVVELVDFDVVVFVVIDLIKNLLKSKASLFKHFNQVVEDLILGLDLLSLRVQRFNFVFVVSPIEYL